MSKMSVKEIEHMLYDFANESNSDLFMIEATDNDRLIAPVGRITIAYEAGAKNFDENKEHFKAVPPYTDERGTQLFIQYFIPLDNLADMVTALSKRQTAKGTSPAVVFFMTEEDRKAKERRKSLIKTNLVEGVALGSIDYSFGPGFLYSNPFSIKYSGTPALRSEDAIKIYDDMINDLLLSQLDKKGGTSLIDIFYERLTSTAPLQQHEKDVLYKYLLELNLLTRSNIKTLKPSSGGFTSTSSFTLDDLFIKMDRMKRIATEHSNYSHDFGEFNHFRPRLIASTLSDDYGIMALSNINKEVPGFIKANQAYATNFKGHSLDYHLFLMGLFHKKAQKHIGKYDQVLYEGVHGIPHYEESSIPLANLSGQGYKDFNETEIDQKQVSLIINNYRSYQDRFGNTIIHGDWKEANVPNGHLVDYSLVGRGFAIDELAYFLSDARFKISREGLRQLIDTYSQFRTKHDPAFSKTEAATMHRLADSSLLTQLVLRHSVMNKRDMADPEKLKQRQYYQHAINKLLKEGSFI